MINLISPINTLGYGIASYNILRQLVKRDENVVLYTIGEPDFTDDIIIGAMKNQQNPSRELPILKIWHQYDLHTLPDILQDVKPLVGFPIFELDAFAENEVESMEHCDKIFVCSQWAKDIIVNNTKFNDKDVHVVPLGVDHKIFKPTQLKGRNKTIFFNCGKWEKRKGHDVILECFNTAFTHSDEVELWMMCDNPFIGQRNEEWRKLYKTSELGYKVKIIPRQVSHQDVYSIMAQSDCGVFPARAEGWNLELLEMMACGKNVIATNYSAHTEFCDENNCRLVSIDNMETAYDGVFFDGKGGMWAEISDGQKEQIISHMRDVHNAKQEGVLSVNQSGIDTANKFSWENSCQEVVNGLFHT
tara:strand:+ start:506 stop:1582 length:1077 start_codon:yes stop_codon:yes gene_type:complete